MSVENQIVLPQSKFCSLDESAQNLNIKKSEILKLGADGQIRLFIKVPEGINIMEVEVESFGLKGFHENNMDVATLNKFLEGGRVKYFNLNLNYLTLSKRDCIEVFKSPDKVKYAHIFNSGFVVKSKSIKSTPKLVKSIELTNDNDKCLKYFDGSNSVIFITCLVSFVDPYSKSVICKSINFTADSIFVLRSELDKIESDIVVANGLNATKISFKNQIYTSKKLARLTLAAREFWHGTNLDGLDKDYKKPPKDIEVKKFLCENGVFDETLARIACGIIRPKYATRTASLAEKLDKADYITNELIGLWHASTEFWSQFDPESPLTHRGVVSADVEKWLTKNHDFSQKRSIAGASIIRPNAIKGRPKKKE